MLKPDYMSRRNEEGTDLIGDIYAPFVQDVEKNINAKLEDPHQHDSGNIATQQHTHKHTHTQTQTHTHTHTKAADFWRQCLWTCVGV